MIINELHDKLAAEYHRWNLTDIAYLSFCAAVMPDNEKGWMEKRVLNILKQAKKIPLNERLILPHRLFAAIDKA